MAKRTGPTNPILQSLIQELKNKGREQSISLWRRIAIDLEKPTRQRRVVNLSSISRHTKENEIIVVPGKVLGAGNLEHKITISAFQFSSGAKEKIEKAGARIIPLLDLSKENPTGRGIRIIG
ncbi:50S ribosomal protein L18e [Candidatus Woesearchaeota archaeon]|nr:50S ribosomal protein L18e [Candidatus Woesearchaeota archaeon]